MCGIVGILKQSEEPLDFKHLRLMTDALEHRGPDDFGYGFTGSAGSSIWKDAPPLLKCAAPDLLSGIGV